jgi:hypothetical protein
MGRTESRELRSARGSLAAEADYFVYKASGEYWDYVNSEIVADIIGSYYRAIRYLAAFPPSGPSSDVTLTWSRRLDEHFEDGELLSLRFDANEFLGGAHGTRGIYTKNFGGPSMGKLHITDLFGHDKGTWRFLRDRCSPAYKEHFGKDATLSLFPEDARDPWRTFSQWTFDREGLQLHLGTFSGLPYAVGQTQVDIPWRELRSKIAPELAGTLLGRFVS